MLTSTLVALATVSPAQAQPTTGQSAGMIRKLADCGTLADSAAQLACYRQAAEALVRAEEDGAIVIVDREAARTVRRQAFGLSLPSLALFDKGEPEAELNAMSGLVRSARRDSTGRWVLQLDSGATWTQVETIPLRRRPTAGTPVTISRAALGSYKMRIGEQLALRVKRIE